LHEYINFLIRNNFSKNNKIISIGGGVVQDITSFISSIYLRGVDWIFFPTNILTQCDSCIGSKSSINFKNYKNQLGGFYPPSKIFIDINFLKTIGREEIASGLGEMLHYFIINSFKDYKFFMENAELILEGDGDLLGSINKSLSIKKVMVELDEFDKGPRNIFNYGHSFGHALESVTNFSIPHGIAVAYGIDLANYLSVNYGFMEKETRNLIMKASKIVTDEFPLPQIEYDKYFEALKRDKKNIDNHFVFILAETIGKVSKAKVKDSSNLRSLITSYFDKKVYLTDI